MLAALAGAVLYYVVVRLTGLNIGLIAIVVGLMVGGGVRAGSGHRGGRFYQLLAIFLTYCSIVAMNVPLVVEAISQKSKQGQEPEHPPRIGLQPDQAKSKTELKSPEPVAKGLSQPIANVPPGQSQDGAQPAAKGDPGSTETAAEKTKKPPRPAEPPSVVGFLTALVIIAGVLFVVPIYEAFHAPIAGLIYAFALWEAWKINKKVHLTFNGPFRVSAAPEALPPEVVGDGA